MGRRVRYGQDATDQSSSCPARGQPAQGGKGSSLLVAWEGTEGSRESKAHLPQAGWEIVCGLLATAAWCGYMAWVCTQPHIPGYVSGLGATLHRT